MRRSCVILSTLCRCSENPITNPNPIYNYSKIVTILWHDAWKTEWSTAGQRLDTKLTHVTAATEDTEYCVAKRRFGKHVPVATNRHSNRRTVLDGDIYSVRLEAQFILVVSELSFPCGGSVKYLHRSPASRRRRREGKSRISQWNMDTSLKKLGPENDCAGEGQQQL
jgi:hypothetical protein